MENNIAKTCKYHFNAPAPDYDHCTEYLFTISIDKDGNIVKASKEYEEDNGMRITDSGFTSMEKGQNGFEDFVSACIERIREEYKLSEMKRLLGAIYDETHKKYFS